MTLKYEIADAPSSEELETIVASMIEEGWEPQGGVAVYTNNLAKGMLGAAAANHFVQAMIKKGSR